MLGVRRRSRTGKVGCSRLVGVGRVGGVPSKIRSVAFCNTLNIRQLVSSSAYLFGSLVVTVIVR